MSRIQIPAVFIYSRMKTLPPFCTPDPFWQGLNDSVSQRLDSLLATFVPLQYVLLCDFPQKETDRRSDFASEDD